jgi:hypothetical protein
VAVEERIAKDSPFFTLDEVHWVDWQDQGCLLMITNHSLVSQSFLFSENTMRREIPLLLSQNTNFEN